MSSATEPSKRQDSTCRTFGLSVHFCLAESTAPVAEAELVQLLKVGIEIIEEDACASTGNVMAALAGARQVLAACQAAMVAP